MNAATINTDLLKADLAQGFKSEKSSRESDMDVLDNHRGRQDRRQSDSALAAGCFDRRHIAERRLPEMEVLRLSNIDWQTYFGASSKLSEKSEHKIFQDTDLVNKTRDHERP